MITVYVLIWFSYREATVLHTYHTLQDCKESIQFLRNKVIERDYHVDKYFSVSDLSCVPILSYK